MKRFEFKILIITLGLFFWGISIAAAQEQDAPQAQEVQPAQPAQQAPLGGTTTYNVAPNLEGTAAESKYTLGPADVIEVDVVRHPEVSGQFIINQDGRIQYNFVGDVEIAGLTKAQAVDKLKEKLSTYVISPEMTMKIVGYNSKVVYVIGEVGRPGKIYMKGDEITVREALIQAGLPTLSAKSSHTLLLTPSETGKAKTRKVNAYDLLYKGDLKENLVMKSGDTLYVPPTAMAKVMRVIQPIAAPITTAAGAGRSVYTHGF